MFSGKASAFPQVPEDARGRGLGNGAQAFHLLEIGVMLTPALCEQSTSAHGFASVTAFLC